LDNLSSGSIDNVGKILTPGANSILMSGDCKNPRDVKKALKGVRKVFHFAANPEVRPDRCDPSTCFKENVYATHILLEGLKQSDVEVFVFASSSTVYGEARIVPTPEDYSPLEPISIYGASKLASEGLVSAYCHTYGKQAVILRLANIIGPKNRHGVIKDFLSQIRKTPQKLKILGDGHQSKSYLYIEDCISAIIKASETPKKTVNVFNIGSEDQIDVIGIARIVAEEARLNRLTLEFVKGADGGRGWNGDVKNMLLDVNKLKSEGWRPNHSSQGAVRLTVRSELHKSMEPRVASEVPLQ
jgi:UDP-glucose 4-epimerase